VSGKGTVTVGERRGEGRRRCNHGDRSDTRDGFQAAAEMMREFCIGEKPQSFLLGPGNRDSLSPCASGMEGAYPAIGRELKGYVSSTRVNALVAGKAVHEQDYPPSACAKLQFPPWHTRCDMRFFGSAVGKNCPCAAL